MLPNTPRDEDWTATDGRRQLQCQTPELGPQPRRLKCKRHPPQNLPRNTCGNAKGIRPPAPPTLPRSTDIALHHTSTPPPSPAFPCTCDGLAPGGAGEQATDEESLTPPPPHFRIPAGTRPTRNTPVWTHSAAAGDGTPAEEAEARLPQAAKRGPARCLAMPRQNGPTSHNKKNRRTGRRAAPVTSHRPWPAVPRQQRGCLSDRHGRFRDGGWRFTDNGAQ